MSLALCAWIVAMQSAEAPTTEAAPPSPAVEVERGGDAPSPAPEADAGDAPSRTGRTLLVAGAVLAALGGAVLLARRTHVRRRTCERCQRRMIVLDELADDAHLDEGQRAEERVGSVDYRVLLCPGCQATRTSSTVGWFSSYTPCPRCRYRTRSETSMEMIPATAVHCGMVRVEEWCGHCHHYHVRNYATELPEPPD